MTTSTPRKKLVTVVGARPQFIKAAVISRLLRNASSLEERLVHTGQHYDEAMSEIFFAELDLPRPDFQLTTSRGGHAAQTASMMVELEQIFLAEKPEVVIVYGDTNTTLAGALAAAKLNVPIAHVEAGLRSFDRAMPEEINRVLTDHVAQWLFCPTVSAVKNLHREGIDQQVHLVGDTMYDAFLHYRAQPYPSATLARLGLAELSYALCTLHRAGNTDDETRFVQLWQGINRIAQELPVILPLHPRSRNILCRLALPCNPGLHVIEPVGYREMLALEAGSRIILTDSGGVQKEAYMHGVPCLTMRENTEWGETVAVGWNQLVGANGDRMVQATRAVLQDGPPTQRPALYGDGQAGARIIAVLAGDNLQQSPVLLH